MNMLTKCLALIRPKDAAESADWSVLNAAWSAIEPAYYPDEPSEEAYLASAADAEYDAWLDRQLGLGPDEEEC
ncbi:MAG: hypothetical protein R3C70_17855 [Geminicoccaceae bacterium]